MIAKQNVTETLRARTDRLVRQNMLIALVALAVIVVIPSSAVAQGVCTAAGSMSPLPQAGFDCDNALLPGEQFEIIYRVTNNSSTVPGGTPVAADLRGFVTATLACEDSACAAKLPPVLSWVDGGDNGCVTRVAGVASCAAGVGPNEVIIQMVGDGVQIPADDFVEFVTILVQLDEAVTPGMCETVFTRGESESDGLVVDDPALCFPGLTGQAGGSSLLSAIPVELESFEID